MTSDSFTTAELRQPRTNVERLPLAAELAVMARMNKRRSNATGWMETRCSMRKLIRPEM
jgi:hypothetical protein